jgi:hypothetical protein
MCDIVGGNRILNATFFGHERLLQISMLKMTGFADCANDYFPGSRVSSKQTIIFVLVVSVCNVPVYMT